MRLPYFQVLKASNQLSWEYHSTPGHRTPTGKRAESVLEPSRVLDFSQMENGLDPSLTSGESAPLCGRGPLGMDEFPTSGTVCDECGASALSEMYVPTEYRYPRKATTQCSSDTLARATSYYPAVHIRITGSRVPKMASFGCLSMRRTRSFTPSKCLYAT